MRLFVGLSLSYQARAALGEKIAELEAGSAGLRKLKVRWIEREQLHFTLKFLGEVGEERKATIEQALLDAAKGFKPIETEITDLGCFPPRGPVRVIWAGVADAGMICMLQRSVEDKLFARGFDREQRSFSAHITLARVKSDQSQGALRELLGSAELPGIPQLVSQLTLYRSHLDSFGAKYENSFEAPLNA